MNPIFIERVGYGTQFNQLSMIGKDTIKKESKNEYGHCKIKKEIQFLQYIQNHSIPFSIPTVLEIGETYYIMKYLSGYMPLYQYFPSASVDRKRKICNRIYEELHRLHTCTKQDVSKNQFLQILHIETKDKIYQRYNEIVPLLDRYSFLKKVNHVVLQSFEESMAIIEKRVHEYVNSLEEYQLCVIHGDCQFNNILYNPSTDDMVFIDPRGYFGDKDLYGISEYDDAKVRFALTGYDAFDNMDIQELDIEDDNLTLPDMFLMKDVCLSDFIGLLTITIWLANAHCFKNNIHKTIYSFYYARYIATMYL
uniref:Aminoglycoside phosphotransferase domain-containing protein n=1 Tax=viral metagenome TaxID=1070528 RepID=A0A6C0KLW6_9ZZZZ